MYKQITIFPSIVISSSLKTYRPVLTAVENGKGVLDVDYDGVPPDGELNSFDTYEKFRDLLFTGYKKAIEHLNDGCFFVVMTGDSRDKNGGYHCHEAETVVFFKENGLSVYNQIVYVECEFTRLAHAKKTLHTRKFPKREQKIIVAYKGDISKIKDNFAPIGRL